MVDLIHLCACAVLFIKGNLSFFSANVSPDFVVLGLEIGSILLIFCNLADLRATLTAHRMFYKWSKSSKRASGFLSTSTRVDAVISTLHTAGSILYAISTSPFSRTLDHSFVLFSAVSSSILVLLGSLANIVASMPSLDYMVPATMARAQNAIVSTFLMASLTRLHVLLILSFGENGANSHPTLRWLSMGADGLVICGSILNFIRVLYLLRKVQYWANDGSKTETVKPPRGILSWFKASRSNEGMSDYESDMENQTVESDDDGKSPSSYRGGRWSRI